MLRFDKFAVGSGNNFILLTDKSDRVYPDQTAHSGLGMCSLHDSRKYRLKLYAAIKSY